MGIGRAYTCRDLGSRYDMDDSGSRALRGIGKACTLGPGNKTNLHLHFVNVLRLCEVEFNETD